VEVVTSIPPDPTVVGVVLCGVACDIAIGAPPYTQGSNHRPSLDAAFIIGFPPTSTTLFNVVTLHLELAPKGILRSIQLDS